MLAWSCACGEQAPPHGTERSHKYMCAWWACTSGTSQYPNQSSQAPGGQHWAQNTAALAGCVCWRVTIMRERDCGRYANASYIQWSSWSIWSIENILCSCVCARETESFCSFIFIYLFIYLCVREWQFSGVVSVCVVSVTLDWFQAGNIRSQWGSMGTLNCSTQPKHRNTHICTHFNRAPLNNTTHSDGSG